MDQSLFAAPHGLSQRITSFFACACQGIHQMPLRHLIVLIANAHPSGRSGSLPPASAATFYNRTVQECHQRFFLRWSLTGNTPSVSRAIDKTSFSRYCPVMRGQATSTSIRTTRAEALTIPDTFMARSPKGMTIQTYLLFTMYTEQAQGISPSANLFSSRKTRTAKLKTPNLLVELSGIEPLTPCLQSRCSPS